LVSFVLLILILWRTELDYQLNQSIAGNQREILTRQTTIINSQGQMLDGLRKVSADQTRSIKGIEAITPDKSRDGGQP
jgi:hypothetical protein